MQHPLKKRIKKSKKMKKKTMQKHWQHKTKPKALVEKFVTQFLPGRRYARGCALPHFRAMKPNNLKQGDI